MNEKQMPPTQEILDACDQVSLIIRAYLDATQVTELSGRFEAPLEVYSSLKLLVRYADSMLLLARDDLVLLPAANVVARSFLETGYRAAWLLSSVDPFEREAKWVCYLETAVDHYKKLAKSEFVAPDLREIFETRGSQHRVFAESLRNLLDREGYEVPGRYPKFQEIVESGVLPKCYHLFVLLSAYTHSNFAVQEIYRRNLGCGKELGEFIEARDWRLPLSVAGGVFFDVAKEFLRNMDVDVTQHFPDTLKDELATKLENLSQS